MTFVRKSVNAQGGVGADLRELREQLGWSIDEASRRTKILPSLIRTWEEERWKDIDDPVFSERLFCSYVRVLGGAEQYFVQKYREGLVREGIGPDPGQYLPRPRKVRWLDLAVGARVRTLVIFGAFVALLTGYVVMQVRDITVAPPLTIFEPHEGARLEDPRIKVSGQTIPEATVMVNDRNASVDSNGMFSMEIDVPRGTTLVVVSAKKRHGRETIVVRRVVYDQPIPPIRQ